MTLRQKLLDRAGITEELLEQGDDDADFHEILEALGAIHIGKSVLYGDYMETHGSDPELFCLIMHFCDLRRKFLRAENFIHMRADGKNISKTELLDTYTDIAVYGMLGVQLLEHLAKRTQDDDT